MWWVGTSAMKTGNMELAIKKFRSMLEVNPNLHRVRLELAATYFQMQRYEEAKKELEAVKAVRPPEAVLKNVEQLLAAINEATRKVVWNVRLAQGIQYDTNISTGPTERNLPVSGGTLTLTDEQIKLAGYAAITNFSGNILYNISKERGFMWNTAVDVYNSAYFQYGKFNYFLTDINTGPWWAGRQDILKVPVGYTYQEYGSENLSNVFHIDPNYEHFFGRNFSLKGSFRYSRERFYDIANYSLDNDTRRYEISPSFYFGNRKHIISLSAAYENSNANARQFCYDGQYYAISYFTRFPTQTEIFLRYQWSVKEYKEIPFLYDTYRFDRRNTITAVINQNFYKNFFASFAVNYIDNNSSTGLYKFEKETYTLSIGAYF
jgi:tetratricopeptide (TPR) repeat protein